MTSQFWRASKRRLERNIAPTSGLRLDARLNYSMPRRRKPSVLLPVVDTFGNSPPPRTNRTKPTLGAAAKFCRGGLPFLLIILIMARAVQQAELLRRNHVVRQS